MTSALRDWLLVVTLLVIVWRFLPPWQALSATVMCAGALWLVFHPAAAAHILTHVTGLDY
jgi:hypothetical protein